MTNYADEICLTLYRIEATIDLMRDIKSNKRRWIQWEIRIRKKPRRKRAAQQQQQAVQRKSKQKIPSSQLIKREFLRYWQYIT